MDAQQKGEQVLWGEQVSQAHILILNTVNGARINPCTKVSQFTWNPVCLTT